MTDDTQKFTKKDLVNLLFCLIVIFLIFILPEISVTTFFRQLNHLVSFDSSFYDYKNPPIFFSVGEAISALAILFAVYQFKKEKWSLALKIRNYIEKTVIVSISLGILFSIFASFVTFTIPRNIFELSIFWQILSSLFIAFSVVFLLLKATNKNLFNKKNAKRFYETLVWEISRPDDERLNLALNVLLDNFENICKSATKYDSKSEANCFARNILDVILSDRSMVKLITTKRFDGLMYILSILKKYDLNQHHSSQGIPMIFQGLFLDPDSFLYKQLDNNGLALSTNIYESIFGTPQILNNFDLFGYPTLEFSVPDDVNGSTVTVFIQSISKSIKTYLVTGKVPVGHVNKGIKYLSDLFGVICSNIKNEQETGNGKRYGKNSGWWLLNNIARFLGHDYLFIGHRERFDGQDAVLNQDIVATEKIAKETNFHSYLAVNEAVAAAIYKAFEQLSRIEKELDTYHVVLDLLNGMTSEPNLREGYMLPFTKRMWEQIGKNVLGKHYPMVLKSYLNFVGFCLAAGDGQRKGWSGEQAERMRRLLYIDLKPQLELNEKMVDGTLMKDALLPDCMSYEEGKFTYTFGFGRGPIVVIDPPPEGSESALEDVDWKNSRNLV